MHKKIAGVLMAIIMALVFYVPISYADVTAVGVSGELRARARQDDSSGSSPRNRVQDRYVFTGFAKFGNSGCYKLSARAATGSEFDSYWNNTSIGDADRDAPFNLRNFWLDYACLDNNGHLQIGDLLPYSKGSLGVHGGGWIDRALRYRGGSHAQDVVWVFTVGDIDPNDIDEPDIFSRGHNEFNYGQLLLTKNYRSIEALAEVTFYDDSVYFRSGGVLDIKHYGDIVDQANFEGLLVESELQGYTIGVDKKLIGWNVHIGFVDRRSFRGTAGSIKLSEEGFFGDGENTHLVVAKKKALGPLDLRIRVREGDAPFRAEVDVRYRFSFVADS